MTQEVLDCLQSAEAPAGTEESPEPAGPAEEAIPSPEERSEPDPEETPGGAGEKAGDPAPEPGRFLRAHYDSLMAAGRQLQRELPDFDPGAAMRDPEFIRLTAPGVGLDPRRAWLALHPEILARQAAEEARALLARSLSSGADRPREGGNPSPAVISADYRRLSRAEQKNLKERILQASARGEKIYP